MGINPTNFFITNSPKLDTLAQRFGNYSSGITKSNIEHFISQFEPQDMATALKLLENIDYYDGPRITNLARSLGNEIKAVTNNQLNDVLFYPIKPSYGTSTESVQRKLRQTLSLTPAQRQEFNRKFIGVSQFTQLLQDSHPKQIVFLDDFIGSGDTVIRTWGNLQAYENDEHEYYVAVYVAYEDAIKRIEEETLCRFEVIAARTLHESDRSFNTNNTIFTQPEKEVLKKYCGKLHNRTEHQYGHRNGQSLVIFSERAPNNALPILHQATQQWIPLFPRNL